MEGRGEKGDAGNTCVRQRVLKSLFIERDADALSLEPNSAFGQFREVGRAGSQSAEKNKDIVTELSHMDI